MSKDEPRWSQGGDQPFVEEGPVPWQIFSLLLACFNTTKKPQNNREKKQKTKNTETKPHMNVVKLQINYIFRALPILGPVAKKIGGCSGLDKLCGGCMKVLLLFSYIYTSYI
jgi:hypothetical protein